VNVNINLTKFYTVCVSNVLTPIASVSAKHYIVDPAVHI